MKMNSDIESNKEIDMPFAQNDADNADEQKLSDVRVKALERFPKFVDSLSNAETKVNAYNLIRLSIFILLGILIFDTILNIYGKEISGISGDFAELLKYVVTFCIGYLFAKGNKHDN